MFNEYINLDTVQTCKTNLEEEKKNNGCKFNFFFFQLKEKRSKRNGKTEKKQTDKC